MKTTRLVTLLGAITWMAAIAFAADAPQGTETKSAPPASYPLKTCVVSGETLGEHGTPVKVTSNGTDVYLCCKSCIKKFNKDSAKYVKTVKDASAKGK